MSVILLQPAGRYLSVSGGSRITPEPEAFPAVTVPLLSLTKQGLSFDMLSMLLPCRGNSSTFTSTGPEGQRNMFALYASS